MKQSQQDKKKSLGLSIKTHIKAGETIIIRAGAGNVGTDADIEIFG